jgi:DnaJ like chaperone protein
MEPYNQEEQYRQILGITREDSPGDIKRKYKDLLTKYHPDKVQHLGVEFQEMAEDKTRNILEAYKFFQNQYHI